MSNVNYHNYKISYLDQIKKRRREIIKKKKHIMLNFLVHFTLSYGLMCVCVYL